MTDAPDPDRRRLSDTYASYLDSEEVGSRWSLGNPGNRMILEERNRRTVELLDGAGLLGRPLRVLDLGCGGATVLPDEVRVSRRIGIDLLEERLPAARGSGVLDAVACADGTRLPFPDDSFDLVVLSTVLSSVDSPAVRRAIGAEALRATAAGGAVLLYDMRVRNPANRAVSPVRRAELPEVFPGATVTAAAVTVNPLVARRLGDRQWLYDLLSRTRVACSHRLAVLRPTEPG